MPGVAILLTDPHKLTRNALCCAVLRCSASLCVWLCRNVEWRLFWIGHASGICVLDYEERVVFTLLHLAVLGLLMYEGCRRLMGGLAGLW